MKNETFYFLKVELGIDTCEEVTIIDNNGKVLTSADYTVKYKNNTKAAQGR